jgi:RNA polymerase sigma-70 factor (ECF subfamily)
MRACNGVGNEVTRMIDETTSEADETQPLAPPTIVSHDAPSDLLVERARQGDQQAFAALFEAYNARFCTYLARLVGNDELGRDLAQDTFIAAWRALPQMLGELRFGPWLYRIATNIARSHLRRARLLSWLPFGLENIHALKAPSTEPEPGAHLADTEGIKLALSTLAPQMRICLLMQIEGGFSQREIAKALGISEKSVSAYVSRGREQFRRAHRALEAEMNQDSEPSGGSGGREHP